MFYTTDTNAHGLPHDPFKAIVSPRPIGWIGSRSAEGRDNLAPYSYFNAVSEKPKIVMFSSSGVKDSVRNIGETGVFTVSLAGRALAENMNISSAPFAPDVSEFEAAGLTATQGTLVNAAYVGEAFAALECRLTAMMEAPALDGERSGNTMVFGQVVGVHIRDEALNEKGLLDMAIVRPLGRMGYMDYCDSGDVFAMMRPR